MATDQFGNELTEEELYRLMIQQQRMGLQPGPVDTFANMPATPPSIDYNQVMEDWSDPGIVSAPAFDVPRPATTASVTPTWDTGAVSGVPQTAMTRHERSKLQLPIGAFTPLPDFNVPAFTPVGPTQEVPARIRQTIPTANDPTGGLSATDPNLQGVTPTSTAQHGGYHRRGWFDPFFDLEGLDESMPYTPGLVETQPSKSIGEMYESAASGIGTGIMDAFGIDTQQHMDNVGMINKLSQSDMLDVPTGWTNEMYAAGLKAQDFVQSGANPLLAMAGSYPYQGLTEAFRATVDPTISYEEAMRMAAVQGLGGMIGAAGGLPAFEGPIGELIDDTVEKNVLGITTPDVTPSMWDTSAVANPNISVQATKAAADPTSYEAYLEDKDWHGPNFGRVKTGPGSKDFDNWFDTQINKDAQTTPTFNTTMFDDIWTDQTVSPTDTLAVKQAYVGPGERKSRDEEAAANVETFVDIPVAKPTKPAKKTSRTTKTKSTVKKVSETDEIAAMVREIQHRNAIRDQVTRDLANARDRGTPSHAEVQAAINAMMGNEFGGMRGIGFMGADIGREDGGGYTGGDFSSGEGWE